MEFEARESFNQCTAAFCQALDNQLKDINLLSLLWLQCWLDELPLAFMNDVYSRGYCFLTNIKRCVDSNGIEYRFERSCDCKLLENWITRQTTVATVLPDCDKLQVSPFKPRLFLENFRVFSVFTENCSFALHFVGSIKKAFCSKASQPPT